MGIARELSPEGIWRIRLTGTVTSQDSISNLLEIPEVHRENTLYSIVVYSDDVILPKSANARKNTRIALKRILKDYRKVIVAFVANADLNYGHVRQICSEVETDRIDMEVFRAEADAFAWVKQLMAE